MDNNDSLMPSAWHRLLFVLVTIVLMVFMIKASIILFVTTILVAAVIFAIRFVLNSPEKNQ